ncbi:MAG: TRAP transporter large permease subunit, partial [Betaproteobacteria bacterium]|nr:TRAP transporter large permease subunit [Betaproteobacteria bacterium]
QIGYEHTFVHQAADFLKGLEEGKAISPTFREALAPLAAIKAPLGAVAVLGAVMDELSMILLTIPIFFPLVMGLDFGMPKESVGIWFGIMVLMVVEFGLLAPPVGLNVYVVNSMAREVPIAESYRGVMPFLLSDSLRTLLLLFFPGICLWLVSVLN